MRELLILVAMTTDLPALLSAANAILPDVIAIRRRAHRRPEIGLQLPITQALVVEELERLGLSPKRGSAVSSVTATIDGGRPGPTILLRGDMDALPLHEETGLDFASEVAGTMHACGHDCHIAMLLGAARLLAERRAEIPGRVLLMFQPGEEGYAGARYMLDEGLLDVPTNGPHGPVTGAFAIHIGTRYPTGTIRLRPGPQMASSDVISITVHGSGGHASTPHLAVDPITVAAEIILGLQTMVTRRVDPFDPAVITIANVIAGTTNNIIPETAFMKGTLRTVSEATRARIKPQIERLARGIAEAHGATAEVATRGRLPGDGQRRRLRPVRRRRRCAISSARMRSRNSAPRSWAPRTSRTSSRRSPAQWRSSARSRPVTTRRATPRTTRTR